MPDIKDIILFAFDHDRAMTCVILAEQWLEKHPEDQLVTLRYAEMLYLLTRYEDALQVYLDALDTFPESRSLIYAGLGRLYRYRGQFAEAETWFHKATQEDPDDATYLIFLGAAQARQGKLTEAEASHRRATKCTAGCIDEAWHNLGLVLRGQGYVYDAADCFREALKRDPEYQDAEDALRDVEFAIKTLERHSKTDTD